MSVFPSTVEAVSLQSVSSTELSTMTSIHTSDVVDPLFGLSVARCEPTWISSCVRGLLSSFREALASVAEPMRDADMCEDV